MLKRTEPKRITICGVDFAIFPFGAMKAANLSGELGKFLGPIVAGALPLIGSSDDIGELDLADAMPMITGAFNALDGDVIEKLLGKLLLEGNISCEYIDDNGSRVQSKLTRSLLDEIFCQDIEGLYKLAFEVINFNYRGFFQKLLSQSGSLSDKAQKIVLGSTGSLTQASSAT